VALRKKHPKFIALHATRDPSSSTMPGECDSPPIVRRTDIYATQRGKGKEAIKTLAPALRLKQLNFIERTHADIQTHTDTDAHRDTRRHDPRNISF
jgi:hypothetical protein